MIRIMLGLLNWQKSVLTQNMGRDAASDMGRDTLEIGIHTHVTG